MQKVVLAVIVAFSFTGCAASLPMFIAYTGGAVTVLENSVTAVECYKKAKDTLKGIDNNSSCGD